MALTHTDTHTPRVTQSIAFKTPSLSLKKSKECLELVCWSQKGLTHSKKESLALMEKPELIVKHNCCAIMCSMCEAMITPLISQTREDLDSVSVFKFPCTLCPYPAKTPLWIYIHLHKMQANTQAQLLEIWLEFLKEIQSFGSSCRLKKKKRQVT
ncbi:hypothetical protein HJG60_011344 [Phyllostomus discolor]|uniref:Uncharacterized protein n=1 Tax=Phyllostomus discolor TaxID=89673 RepID=A0A834A418_9CHIR|nr:hypothetical protein HJG60_011344 [Phyllostomus discolor]